MRGEIRRVLLSGKTIIFAAVLIVLSIWQYHNEYFNQTENSQEINEYYAEYVEALKTASPEEQKKQIDELVQQTESELESFGADGSADEQSLNQLLLRQSALLRVSEQYSYVSGYKDYLDKVQSDAEYVGRGGIFGSADGFSARNAAKTASDYAPLQSVADKVCLTRIYGFETIADGDLTGLFSAIFVLYLAIMLSRFQRRGLWDMLYASGGGRARLFGAQIAVLLLGSIFFTMLLYGARVAACSVIFKESAGWGYPVQCSELFKSCTVMISMWGMLGLILIFHMAAAFASAAFFWCLCIFIRQEKLAILACLCIAVLEWVLYSNISDNSSLVLLKVLNLASLWDIQETLRGYQNVPIGKFPIGQYVTNAAFIFCVTAICIYLSVMTGCRRHPKGKAALSERLMECASRRTSNIAGIMPPIFSEWRKLFNFEHGILLILLFAWLAYTIFGGKSVLYLQNGGGIKEGIYSQLEGMPISDAVQYVNEKSEENDKAYASLLQAQSDFNKKKISYDEWNSVYQANSYAGRYVEAYEALREELARLQNLKEETGRDIHVVSPLGAEALAGKLNLFDAFDIAKYRKRLLWCLYELLVLTFLLAGVFTYERKTKMLRLLEASPKGRMTLNIRKCRMSAATAGVLWLASSIMQLRQIAISGGSFNWLLEPAPVLEVFAALPAWLPLGAAIAGICLIRLALLLGVCGVLLGIGSRCKSTVTAAAAGGIVFLLPSALEYVLSLRFFPLSVLDAVQNLWENPGLMLAETLILVTAGCIGYAAAITSNSSNSAGRHKSL